MAIRKIVIGADGSAGSAAAMEWVVELAVQIGATVTAVHATAAGIGTANDDPAKHFHDAGRRSLSVQLDYWCLPLRNAGVHYEPRLEGGQPASTILGVAEEVAADPIVVGRRGRGALAELILGSVSRALVETAPLPVVVVGPRARAGRT